MAARKGNSNCAGKFAWATGPCVGPATLRCGSCGAVNYCSRPHQTKRKLEEDVLFVGIAHWKVHKNECSQMAQQMTRAVDLHDFPFSFAAEATQLVDEGAVTICSFLEKRELHLKGLWQGECECADSTFTSSYPAEWQLPSSVCPCADPSKSSGELLADWMDYYYWRKLPFDSPVAILLHWPLTLYHAIQLVPRCKQITREKLQSVIRIHYLGPEKELPILPVFAELMALLPGTHVHIDMIGPAVPASRDGEVVQLAEYSKCVDPQCTCKRARETLAGVDMEIKSKHLFLGHVTLKLWRGLYHDRYLDLVPAPDVVVAPNAGIAAFPSWQPTIKLLSVLKVPAVFTDYCEEAANLAANAVCLVHPDMLTYPVQTNPFRQPFSPQGKVLNLPTYSNCFMFGIN